MANKIMHVYTNVNLQNGHEGLTGIAKKENKVDVNKLAVGQFALFINRAFTAVKVFAANNVVVHYKHPRNHILDYKALRLIPAFFDGQNLGYMRALKQVIEQDYPHLVDRKSRHTDDME